MDLRLNKMKVTVEKVIDKISSYRYVSFDMFDTLIKRNIQKPTDLFTILELEGVKKYGAPFYNFKKKRIETENEIRSSQDKEVTLDQIYNKLLNNFTKNVLIWAKQEEQKLELKFCTANEWIKPIYDYCVEHNKKIEIITDIYLPESLIKSILTNSGFDKWEHLYVSSSVGYMKTTGKLFTYAINKLKISPSELIHIGDNRHSDIEMSKKAGIDSVYIPTHMSHILYYQERPINTIGDNVAREFLNNHILSISGQERLGFQNMGPLLYGFSQWLLKDLKTKNIKKVYFLSRDGQILKKAFDIFNDDLSIESYYFYASRRVLQVPPLAENNSNYSTFISSLFWPDSFSFKYFLKSLGLEDRKIISKISLKHSIPLDHKFSKISLKTNKILIKVFNDEESLIKKNALDELQSFRKYLQQMHVSGQIAIVDIGWMGNMQRNFEKLFKDENMNIAMHGYYVGVNPIINHADQFEMHGYCFGPQYNVHVFDIESKINDLFEQIFMADHGSVRRLVVDPKSKKCVPEEYEFEQKDKNIINLLNDYQNGALQFVNLFLNQIGNIKLSSNFVISGVLDQFLYPTKNDANAWGNIIYKNIDESKLIHANYYYSILMHPKKFARDYKRSLWKEGYLAVHSQHRFDYHWVAEHLHKPKFKINKKNK